MDRETEEILMDEKSTWRTIWQQVDLCFLVYLDIVLGPKNKRWA